MVTEATVFPDPVVALPAPEFPEEPESMIGIGLLPEAGLGAGDDPPPIPPPEGLDFLKVPLSFYKALFAFPLLKG